MSKKILIIFTVIALLMGGLFVACDGDDDNGELPTKDEIVFGGSRPITGGNAIWEEVGYGPLYRLWISEVNAAGGLYIAEYGKSLPIVYEDYIYDDTSDIGTMTRQLERLMTVDQVDFVLSPASTASLFAGAPIFSKYEYVLLGAEGGATSIEDQLPALPYFFGVLNYSNRYQLPVFADLCLELGIDEVAMIWIQDLHGIEYSGVATTEFENAGIEVLMSKSVPPDVSDVSLLLLEADASGADALCMFAYPDQNFLIIGTMIGMGINFDAILVGPGGNISALPGIFGPNIEGLMFEGAWNCNSTPGAQEFCDLFDSVYPPGTGDWWGHILYWGAVQFFELLSWRLAPLTSPR